MGKPRYRRAAGDVLNGCANAAAIASGSRRAPKGSNAWRRTSMVRRLPRIATTPMRSALPFRASRRSASGASGGTAFRANATSCIPTRRTTAGRATDAGFCYRIVYIDPGLVQDALHGNPLPFVGHPVVDAARLPASGAAEVWDFDEDMDDVARTELVVRWRICWSVPLRAPRGHRARLRSAACRVFGTSSPPLRPNGARWMSLNGWPVSTVGRSPGNSARHSAPVPAASAPCGNWTLFGDC